MAVAWVSELGGSVCKATVCVGGCAAAAPPLRRRVFPVLRLVRQSAKRKSNQCASHRTIGIILVASIDVPFPC